MLSKRYVRLSKSYYICAMKTTKHIEIITAAALVTIFALQMIWLTNTFLLLKSEIRKECSVVLDKALYEEINLITQSVPDGTKIVGVPGNDTVPANTCFYDSIQKMGFPFSVAQIDSIAEIFLLEADIYAPHLIQVVNPQTKEVYEQSYMFTIPRWGAIYSDIIPINLDLSKGIQLVLLNPYLIIFRRLYLLLLATFIMMIFVSVCIYRQIKIIVWERKEAKKREDFSYALIHDMKSPLTNIIMTLNLLGSERIEAKPELKSRYLSISMEGAEQLLKLTNKVLALSKLENRKLEMNRTQMELRPVFNRLIERYSSLTSKNVVMKMDLQAENLFVDAEYMEEMFGNLIENAIKYSKETGDIEILITSDEDTNRYMLTFTDNGVGISKKAQKHIFDKFERGDAIYRSNRAAGFGLGLNFVYQVVSAHGGSVMLNSELGEYTKFIIYIPKQTDTV